MATAGNIPSQPEPSFLPTPPKSPSRSPTPGHLPGHSVTPGEGDSETSKTEAARRRTLSKTSDPLQTSDRSFQAVYQTQSEKPVLLQFFSSLLRGKADRLEQAKLDKMRAIHASPEDRQALEDAAKALQNSTKPSGIRRGQARRKSSSLTPPPMGDSAATAAPAPTKGKAVTPPLTEPHKEDSSQQAEGPLAPPKPVAPLTAASGEQQPPKAPAAPRTDHAEDPIFQIHEVRDDPSLARQLSKEQRENEELRNQVGDLTAALAQQQADLKQQQTATVNAVATKTELTTQNEQLAARVKELEAQLADQSRAVATPVTAGSDHDPETSELARKVATLEKTLADERLQHKKTTDSLNAQLTAAEASSDEAKQDLRREIKSFSSRLQQAQKGKAESDATVADQEAIIGELTRKEEQLRAELTKASTKNDELGAQVKEDAQNKTDILAGCKELIRVFAATVLPPERVAELDDDGLQLESAQDINGIAQLLAGLLAVQRDQDN